MTWRSKPLIGRFARRDGVRRALIFGLLFAFLAQAQLAATHFHIGPNPQEQAFFGDAAHEDASGDRKSPDSDHCPVSKLVAACHNFLAGMQGALPPPVIVIDQGAVPSDTPLVVQVIALNWQSRAPPGDASTA